MRLVYGSLAVVALLIASIGIFAQPPAGPGGPGGGGPGGMGGSGRGGGRGRGPFIGGPGSPTADGSRAVTDGGIKVAGWTGKVDASEEKAGMTINDAKLDAGRPRPPRHHRPRHHLLEERRESFR